MVKMIPTRIRRACRWMSAIVICVTATTSAPAFFFKGWPGDGLARTQTLVKPGTPDPGGRPTEPSHWQAPENSNPTTGGEQTAPQEGSNGGGGGGGGNPPPAVPEPGTMVIAAVGLGAVALVRKRRTRPGN